CNLIIYGGIYLMKRIVLVAALCSALSSVVAPVTAVAERKGLVGLDSLTSYTSQTIPRAFWTTFSVFRHDIGSPDVQKTLKEHVCKDRVMQLGGHYSLQVVVCQKKSMKRKAR
ncbi:hypothetical protein ACMX1E_05815, partial [Bartonella bacilliformis]|uniref:hypothetical protein n=4 Tax=Bartonella bacilliformis TaxID=774 RepID=UPI0039E6CCB2